MEQRQRKAESKLIRGTARQLTVIERISLVRRERTNLVTSRTRYGDVGKAADHILSIAVSANRHHEVVNGLSDGTTVDDLSNL